MIVKIANPAWKPSALEAQTAALRAAAASDVVVPTLVHDVTRVLFGDRDYLAHVVTFIEGESLFDRSSTLGSADCRALGTGSRRDGSNAVGVHASGCGS